MKKLLLTSLVAATMASATAQTINTAAGWEFRIQNVEAATVSGNGTLAYQWFRNGVAIPDATAADYTVPMEEAQFCNQTFQRRVRVTGTGANACAGVAEGWSNEITVSFCTGMVGTTCTCTGGTWGAGDCHFDGTRIGDLCWAKTNVTASATFTASPTDIGGTFTVANSGSACPTGWRLPTQAEFNTLMAHHRLGTYNGARGFYFGATTANATNCSEHDMNACIFLRASTSTTSSNDYYFSSTPGTGSSDNRAVLNLSGNTAAIIASNTSANRVRCVRGL